MKSLKDVCVQNRSNPRVWAQLPQVIATMAPSLMPPHHVYLAELKFNLVMTEVMFYEEMNALWTLTRETIRWKCEDHPLFNRRHYCLLVSRLKKYSTYIYLDLAKDWSNLNSICLDLDRVFDILDFNLSTKVSLCYVAYCEVLYEFRHLILKALDKEGTTLSDVFSTWLHGERTLAPLYRLIILRNTLRAISMDMAAQATNLEERCQATLQNVNGILDRCLEVYNILHGSKQLNELECVLEFGTSLASLKFNNDRPGFPPQKEDLEPISTKFSSLPEPLVAAKNPQDFFSRIDVLRKSFDDGPLYQYFTEGDKKTGETEVSEKYEDENEYEGFLFQPKYTRSYWCEIEPVLKSGLLLKLEPRERILQEAKFEIITSEVSYLKSLNVLIEVFLESKSFRSTLTEEDFDLLFGNIISVKKVSEKFLCDLCCALKEDLMLEEICQVVRRHAIKSFRVYIDYCTHQPTSIETLNRLMSKNAEMRRSVISLENSPECQGYSLLSFLTLPMQRITRLPLLVEAVQRRLPPATPPFMSAQLALTALNQLVAECNDGIKCCDRKVSSASFKDGQEVQRNESTKSKKFTFKKGFGIFTF